MPGLFAKHPLTVLHVHPGDQHALPINERRAFESLQEYAFQAIDDEPAYRESDGAVVLEDINSIEFGPSNTEFGPYIVFTVRQDVRKADKATVDVRTEARINEEKERTGGTVSRDRKKEIREAIAGELAGQAAPKPYSVDVVWNTQTQIVYVTGSTAASIELVTNLFEGAFGPGTYLAQVTLANTLPAVDSLDYSLGRDFLTYLYGLGQDAVEITVGGVTMNVTLEGSLTIESPDKVRIVSNDVGSSEIRNGIEAGKMVTAATISMTYGEDYSRWAKFEVKDALLPIKCLVLPYAKFKTSDEFAGALTEQIGNTEEAFDMFRRLLVAYALEKAGKAISPGLMPTDVKALRDNPDMIIQYVPEGSWFVPFTTGKPKRGHAATMEEAA